MSGRKRGNKACFNCNQPGHFARDCPSATKKPANTNGTDTKPLNWQQQQHQQQQKQPAAKKPRQQQAPQQRQQQQQQKQPQQQQQAQKKPQEKKQQQQQQQRVTTTPSSAPAGKKPFISSTTLAYLTDVKFVDLPISAASVQAITQTMGFQQATRVQRDTLQPALAGHDLLAKAKTGTGKTLGFLIPTVERLLMSSSTSGRGGSKGIRCLIMSPTRELACQILAEAKQLLTFHKQLHAHVVYGGTNVKSDVRQLTQRCPDILVGTPGRLEDLLTNYNVLRPLLASMQVLILDEADQLLDMGFRPQIERVLAMLPPKNMRQTLLFSATFAPAVRQFAAQSLRPDHQQIDAVGEGEATVSQVVQAAVVVPETVSIAAILLAALDAHRRESPSDFKVMVFFVTARLTQYYAQLFNKDPSLLGGTSVVEMHSRKSQSFRTKAAKQFREAKSAIMFSSDVSARGMDYPDVSCVIQVGKPSDKAQYVHRTGRTARAGKAGECILLLRPFEKAFLRQLSDLPLELNPSCTAAQACVRAVANGGIDAASNDKLIRSIDRMPAGDIGGAYQSFLGYYNSNLRQLGWSKQQLVDYVNNWATNELRSKKIPTLTKRCVGKMSLKTVHGLNISG